MRAEIDQAGWRLPCDEGRPPSQISNLPAVTPDAWPNSCNRTMILLETTKTSW
jgi:hypothetical protein